MAKGERPAYRADVCRDLLHGHCQHWDLGDAEHAVLHAQVRLITEIATADAEAGLYGTDEAGQIKSIGSTSSVKDDARRLMELLEDEGGWRITR